MGDLSSKVTLRPRSKLQRILALLPAAQIPPPSAEYLAECARKTSAVAPSLDAVRVVLRLGYPGNEVASVSRALDAEVPEADVTGVAWRAHFLLDQIGTSLCAESNPRCHLCPIQTACAYRGQGVDPSKRLVRADESDDDASPDQE